MTKSFLSVEDYLHFSIEEADRRLPYGDGTSQFLDLFLPDSIRDVQPIVLLVHGGCWQARFGLAQMGQFARALAQKGLVVANIAYRRLGNGGGWPNTFLDVAAAADFLPTVATAYRFRLGRTVAVGHSAGGHLALWLAARRFLDPTSVLYTAVPQPIDAVVALAPIPDLVEGAHQKICDDAIFDLIGGSPDEVANRYRAGSPHFYLPLGIPHTHIVGEQDSIVPASYVETYVRKAQRAGDDATLFIVPDAAHFEIVLAGSGAWSTVTKEILQHIDE